MPSGRSVTLATLLLTLSLSIVLVKAAQPADSIPGFDAVRSDLASAKQDRAEQAEGTSAPRWTLGWVIPYPDQHVGFQDWMTNLRAARDGSVWTVDNEAQHIYRFDADGVFRSAIATPGCREGQLGGISSMQVDTDRVYVLRTEGCAPTTGAIGVNSIFLETGSVSLFSREGLYLGSWRPEQWPAKAKLAAIDGKGRVYVIAHQEPASDSERTELYRYARDGKLLNRWEGQDLGFGGYEGNISVDIADDGTIYIGDYARARVQRFSEDGVLLGSWGRQGFRNGEFHMLSDLAVGPSGEVFVLESSGSERVGGLVSRFTAAGRFIGRFDGVSQDPGLQGGFELAVTQEESILVQSLGGSITRSAADGQSRPWQGLKQEYDARTYHGPDAVAISDVGEISMISLDGQRLLRYAISGARLPDLDIGHLLDENGEFGNYFNDLRSGVDDQLVLRTRNGTLVWMDSEGKEIKRRVLEHEVEDIHVFDVTASGEVYVGGMFGERIWHFDADGELLAEWQVGEPRAQSFEGSYLSRVNSILATSDDELWVVGFDCRWEAERFEFENCNFENTPIDFTRYSATGEVLDRWQWGVAERTPMLLPAEDLSSGGIRPLRLELSKQGELILASARGIFVFTPEGQHVLTLSGKGFSSLAMDAADRIVALRTSYNSPYQLHVFERDTTSPWQASYYKDQTLADQPEEVVLLPELDSNWGGSAPVAGLPDAGWAARFRRFGDFETGFHRFHIRADGGVRFWVDDRLLVNEYRAIRVDANFELLLDGQQHDVLLEFSDNAAQASLKLEVQALGSEFDTRLYLPTVAR